MLRFESSTKIGINNYLLRYNLFEFHRIENEKTTSRLDFLFFRDLKIEIQKAEYEFGKKFSPDSENLFGATRHCAPAVDLSP